MISLKAKPVIESRREKLKLKTEDFREKFGRAPHLSVVLIGDHPASYLYVQKKGQAAEKVGFSSETHLLPENTNAETVRRLVQKLNQDSKVDGILIQRPLPPLLSEQDAIYWVDPKKDVDCLHPENQGLLVTGFERFLPCTPAGILELLQFYGYSLKGQVACVIGRSLIVGKPLAQLVLKSGASLIHLHRGSQNPKELCKTADFIFVAAGSKNLIDETWVKPGAVVVDVGINRGIDGKLCGDVKPGSLDQVASALTPVPGGVGPMTIQMLLENTLKAAHLNLDH